MPATCTRREEDFSEGRHKGKTACHPHEKPFFDAALPRRSPSKVLGQAKHSRVCSGQCLATCQIGQHSSPQIPLRLLSAKRDPYAPVYPLTTTTTSGAIGGHLRQWQTLPPPFKPGPITVCPRSGGVKPKTVGNIPRTRGVYIYIYIHSISKA
jgi:hypothetical protein